MMIHDKALVETESIGEETRVWAYAQVMKDARVGSHCQIGGHCFLESGVQVGDRVTIKNQVCLWEGVTLEDDVFVGPGVMFTNDRYPRSPRSKFYDRTKEEWLEKTLIQEGASLGAKSLILPGVTVGTYALVAAGSIVSRDVPAFTIVCGSPAKIMGHICRCGQKLDGLECSKCQTRYKKNNLGLSLK